MKMSSERYFYMDEREYRCRCDRLKLLVKEEGFFEIFADGDDSGDDLLTVKGNVGVISIRAGMVRQHDFFSRIFGDISFSDILSAIDRANQNTEIEIIQLDFNTPGGEVNGVDEVARAVRDSPKVTIAVADELIASAGLFIASQADKIVAVSPNSRIGSIGVIVTVSTDGDDSFMTFNSTDAPNKNPDFSTQEGQEVMVKQLDDLHAVFAARVAEGRGVSIETVNKDFGQGGLLIAADALAVGLIDESMNPVADTGNITSKNTLAVEKADVNVGHDKDLGYTNDKKLTSKDVILEKGVTMSENNDRELKESFDAGKCAGVKSERDRVSALQNWAIQNPSTAELVNEAIASGKTERDIHAEMLAAITKSIATPTVDDNPPLISTEVETSPLGDEKISDEKLKADAKRLAKQIAGGV